MKTSRSHATPQILTLALLSLTASLAFAQGGPGGFGPGGFGGGGPGGRGGGGGGLTENRKVLADFDKDGDKQLNLEERKTAYEALAGQGGGGFGGRGGGNGSAPAGMKLAPADVKNYGKENLYDINVLRTIFIQFEEADWEKRLAAFNNTDIEMPATVTVDGKTYPKVGIHFRGASSFSFVPDTYKRSLNLTFDEFDSKQNLLGYNSINLLNSNGDPSLMRAVVYTEIARQYIPAAKANFMRVVINGENWGIYQNTQQFNKEFAKEWYGTSNGARWKTPGSPNGQATWAYLGDNPELYKGTYAIHSKDDPKDWKAMIGMFKVLNQTPAAELEAKLSPLLDIDGALRFLALDDSLMNEDGYWTRASDYYIFRDSKGKFHIFPHDTNEAFLPSAGGGGPRGPGGPGGRGGRGGRGGGGPGGFGGPGGRGGAESVELSPLINEGNSNRPLASKLFAVPALRAKYLSYVREIAEKDLNWANLGPRIARNRALIADDVKRDTKKMSTYEDFDLGTANTETEGASVIPFRNFAEKRRAFLLKFVEEQQAK